MNTALLSNIVAATLASGFLYVTPTPDTNELVNAGFIEINMQMGDGQGNFAARATDAGKAFLANPATSGMNTQAAGASAPVTPNRPTFERATLTTLPKLPDRKPSGVDGVEKYPFSELRPVTNGQYDGVFVAPTEKMPDPAKSLISAVSAANRRFATVTGNKTTAKGKVVQTYDKTREFKVYPSEDANKPGAWIIRIDDGSKDKSGSASS